MTDRSEMTNIIKAFPEATIKEMSSRSSTARFNTAKSFSRFYYFSEGWICLSRPVLVICLSVEEA